MKKIKAYNNISTPVLTFLALIVFGTASINATPGDLDLTFSGDGKFTDVTGRGNDAAIQLDGKIVVAGEINANFAVARYNPDGSPDITFGIDGKVMTQIEPIISYVNSVAIQPDGKIVAAGLSYGGGWPFFTVVRYNTNGSLDSSFDGDGIVKTVMYSDNFAEDVAIQPDGKIIVAGCTNTLYDFDCDIWALARYNPDGSLDTSFDSDGRVLTPFGIFNQAYLYSIALQGDGKIVAAGYSRNGSTNDFTVVRYNIDGSLDQTFDSDGKAFTPIGSGDNRAYSVSIQPDGKIVVAGHSSNGSDDDFAVVRYNANGSLDTEFDSDGKVTTPIGSGADIAHSVEIQSDGKIVASGYSLNGTNYDFALARYNPNGSLDTTFGGGDGKTTADFDISNDKAYGMVLDNAGRAVVVGESNGRFALARFLLVPRRTLADFDGDGRSDVSVFRSTDRIWYLKQSTAGFAAVQYGLSTDQITPGDFDGDGKTDIAVWRPSTGTWYIQQSTAGFTATQWGLSTDLPVPGDYDGDGRTDIAVWRPSTGDWFVINSGNGQTVATHYGSAGDKPVPGDYDGDGKTDLAVYRPSTGIWFLNRSSQGQSAIKFGITADKVVPADYDGDGKTDIAVYRDGTWYLQQTTAGFSAFDFGLTMDIPVPADYDGDGKADISVWRPSTGIWYSQRSSSGFSATQFGLAGDKPVPASFLPLQ